MANYLIVLFKNKTRKKIIKKFITLSRAKNYFKRLIESSNDEKKFFQLMGLIEAWQSGTLTVVNTKEELVKVADEIKEGKSDVL
jgi:hypothetical protein